MKKYSESVKDVQIQGLKLEIKLIRKKIIDQVIEILILEEEREDQRARDEEAADNARSETIRERLKKRGLVIEDFMPDFDNIDAETGKRISFEDD